MLKQERNCACIWCFLFVNVFTKKKKTTLTKKKENKNKKKNRTRVNKKKKIVCVFFLEFKKCRDYKKKQKPSLVLTDVLTSVSYPFLCLVPFKKKTSSLKKTSFF